MADIDNNKMLRLHLATWNVADQSPPADLSLNSLLGFTDELDSQVAPDIIVVGFQEINSSNEWTKALNQILSGQKEYVLVKSKQLNGMMILTYSQVIHLPYIRNIESASTKCGYGGLWGNKGAVSVRFEIYGVDIIFVNSHLDAFDERYRERIAQYNRILEKQQFNDEDSRNILDHDYVFWMGDLNFRINAIPREEVLTKIENEAYKDLIPYDQLNIAVKDELIFLQFSEGSLDFPPTYKFDQNTDNYDTSEKIRKPAWCDRILWLVHNDAYCKIIQEYEKTHNSQCDIDPVLIVEQHTYTSLSQYKFSDHKPVISSFTARAFPIEPAVEFEIPSTGWVIRRENVARYTMRVATKISKWDWIGLYKVGFKSVLSSYTSWVRPKDADKGTPTIVKFSKSRMKICEGYYCLLFVNGKGEVLGMSEAFAVRSLDQEASSSSSLSSSDVECSESDSVSRDESDSPIESEKVYTAAAMTERGAVDSLSRSLFKMSQNFELPAKSSYPLVRKRNSVHSKSPVNPDLIKEDSEEKELTYEEDEEQSLVHEDMSLDQIREIVPQLNKKRYSDPSVLQRKASNLSSRLSQRSSHMQTKASGQDKANFTKTTRTKHTDL